MPRHTAHLQYARGPRDGAETDGGAGVGRRGVGGAYILHSAEGCQTMNLSALAASCSKNVYCTRRATPSQPGLYFLSSSTSVKLFFFFLLFLKIILHRLLGKKAVIPKLFVCLWSLADVVDALREFPERVLFGVCRS